MKFIRSFTFNDIYEVFKAVYNCPVPEKFFFFFDGLAELFAFYIVSAAC